VGRSRFIRQNALGWGLSMVLFHSVWTYFTDGSFSITLILLTMPVWLAAGWWVAASAWANSERLYERARQGSGSEDAQARVE